MAETVRTMVAGGTALFRQLHRHSFPFVASTLQQRNHRRPNQENGLPFRHVQSEPIQGSHGQTVADKRGYSADYGLRGADADQVPQTVPATGKGLVPVQLPVVRHQSDRYSTHSLCRHRGRATGFQPSENGQTPIVPTTTRRPCYYRQVQPAERAPAGLHFPCLKAFCSRYGTTAVRTGATDEQADKSLSETNRRASAPAYHAHDIRCAALVRNCSEKVGSFDIHHFGIAGAQFGKDYANLPR